MHSKEEGFGNHLVEREDNSAASFRGKDEIAVVEKSFPTLVSEQVESDWGHGYSVVITQLRSQQNIHLFEELPTEEWSIHLLIFVCLTYSSQHSHAPELHFDLLHKSLPSSPIQQEGVTHHFRLFLF
jgi:hypothetical protein